MWSSSHEIVMGSNEKVSFLFGIRLRVHHENWGRDPHGRKPVSHTPTGCKEYRKDSTARWRQIVTSSSIRCQCSDVRGRAFTRKLPGFETTIVITRTILKLNSWDFLMISTNVLLKLLMSCNNSLKVTVLSLWRLKDRKNRYVINEI